MLAGRVRMGKLLLLSLGSIGGALLFMVQLIQKHPHNSALSLRRRLVLSNETASTSRTSLLETLDEIEQLIESMEANDEDYPQTEPEPIAPAQQTADMGPLQICNRKAPISHELDMKINRKYAECQMLNRPPERMTLILLDGIQTFGRTGNNLIEFLHSIQMGRDHTAVVGVMHSTWLMHLIADYWMAIRDDYNGRGMAEFRSKLEREFCFKIFDSYEETKVYKRVIPMDTKEIFRYRHAGPFKRYVEIQGRTLRSLYRHYNTGVGVNMRRKPVGDMCSVIDAVFGDEKSTAKYSVIHSRSLEGEPGLRILGRVAQKSGCDPVAALNMEPDYIKSILEPHDMLNNPILFITDHQRPEILEKLLADPVIGQNILLIPDDASWIGGDITVAVMSDVFIGNPASTFSGFIAKSRHALGFESTYMWRKKTESGKWVDVCKPDCIFNKSVMMAMA